MSKHLHVRRGFLYTAGLVAALAVGVYVERIGVLHGVHDADAAKFYDTVVDLRYFIKNNYVEQVDDTKLMQGAIKGMLGQLDPYSNYFTKEELAIFDKLNTGKFVGIGVEMAQDPKTGVFMVLSPVEDSPALKAGVLAGDRILKVGGALLEGMTYEDVKAKLVGLPGSEIRLAVVHEGEKAPVELTIKRAVVQMHSVRGYKQVNDGSGNWDFLIDPEHRIAYVRITNFMESTAEDLDKALLPLINSPEKLRGIVLDLRFNPGGLLTSGIEVSNRFIDSGVIVSTRGRDGKNVMVAEAKKEGVYPKIPLVVLVNEYSASASEIVAGALKDHNRAVLIGNRTYGKGSVQNLISLGDGESALKLTTAYYYLPSGKNIARKKDSKTWGVEPEAAFLMPLSEEENRELQRSQWYAEIIRPRAVTTLPVAGGTTTAAAGAAAATQGAATQEGFVDRQLQRALEVLLAHQAFNGAGAVVEVTTTRPGATASVPGTVPASVPASAPATVPATVPETAPSTTSQPGASLRQSRPVEILVPN